MRRVFWMKWLLLFAALLSLPVFAETTDHDKDKGPGPAPLERPKGESKAASIEDLKANVKDRVNAATDAWWQSVHELLGQISAADANAFANEIAPGRRQDLFRFAIAARNADAAKLKEMAKNKGAPDAREAAAKEFQRRITDPTTQFLAEHFHLRPEVAMGFAEDLAKAKDDVQKSAQILAKLMGTLNRSQREGLLKASQGKTPEGLDAALKEKINQAANVSLGGNADNAFKQAFKAAYDGVLDRNRQFQQLLSNALSGDAKAKADLVKQFGKDAILDFISAQMRTGNDGIAVDLAKAVARKDSAGNLFLDLAPDNAAFATDAKGSSLFLGNGKANDSIRAALSAFDLANAKDHDSTSFDPQTKGRFQRFTLSDGPSEGSGQSFASPGKDGPVLTKLESGAALPTTVATQPIQQVTTLPPPVTGGGGGTPPPPGPGLLADAKAKEILTAKCGLCHGPSGTAREFFTFTASDLNSADVLRRMRTSILRASNPMPKNDQNFRNTPDGQALLRWLDSKAGPR